MAYLRRKYYYRDEDIPVGLSALYTGFSILEEHPPLLPIRWNSPYKIITLKWQGIHFLCYQKW